MVTIQFTEDSTIDFANPETGKREWYGSDMVKGQQMEFLDVVSANNSEIRLVCIDGEHGIVKTKSIRFI
jgi:hypothetical protein